ncbi:NACHT domain-containing protein [Streptomyces sp. NPDC006798]|uniref:NACHT domain-containing protein n=1 Tax=Streptomyces sp. NPDC006798 TaxID=3155462 RepID=UPI003409204D
MISARPGLGTTMVVVTGAARGTGVFLSPHLVLTCARVVGDRETAAVVEPATGSVGTCRVMWTDRRLDAAVLLVPGGRIDLRPRLSALTTSRPLRGCRILGFQPTGDDDRLDLVTYHGTVRPPGEPGGTDGVIFDFDDTAAFVAVGGDSSFAGLSGAPVFAGSTLLGIVREVSGNLGHRRADCLPLQRLADHAGLRVWVPWISALEQITGARSDDSRYEEEYAEALAARYRTTRLHGLDSLSPGRAAWDLDTSFVDLAAVGNPGHPGRPLSQAIGRVATFLEGNPRILLHGEAGAGKTTLVQWLARAVAAGTLTPGPGPLTGLVPFLVPLRALHARGQRLPTPDRLASLTGPETGDPPPGWAERVLADGRALLLVDGFNEIPRADRATAGRWLSDLLRRYPETRCVATTRPTAVEPEWLARDGFDKVRLLPMDDADIRRFVTAWYDAARVASDDGPGGGNSGSGSGSGSAVTERNLIRQLERDRTLRDLARTPLLCAVICALHRRFDGLTPDTRWQLYDQSLTMLLGRRDQARLVDRAEEIRLTVEGRRFLFQRLAVWMVRNRSTEIPRSTAVAQLVQALTGMPTVRHQGTPEQILDHLLISGGVLQEEAPGYLGFSHRTFRDFLAAREFVEGDHLAEVLRHTHSDEWRDVILLAAGHCDRVQLTRLIQELLRSARSTDDRMPSVRLGVLAVLCSRHAPWLDEETRRRLDDVLGRVLPPRTPEAAELLAELGPDVLRLLPAPDRLQPDALAGVAYLRELLGLTDPGDDES